MQITTNRQSTVALSRMPIVEELGMPSCWVRGMELPGEEGAPDLLSLEAVLDRENTLRLAHAMLSPEIRALQTGFPNFEADEDQEGSGWFHTEVMGTKAYIGALATLAEELGAKRGIHPLG
jgi:hypothetical protein